MQTCIWLEFETIRLSGLFLLETLPDRHENGNRIQILKRKNCSRLSQPSAPAPVIFSGAVLYVLRIQQIWVIMNWVNSWLSSIQMVVNNRCIKQYFLFTKHYSFKESYFVFSINLASWNICSQLIKKNYYKENFIRRAHTNLHCSFFENHGSEICITL